MSEDKMLDVFPVLFDFIAGELPDEEKLSGLVKHVNIAFDDVTEVIGDPWDIQQHSWNSTSQKLSLERLGQTSLARLIGSSDWVSPGGGDFSSSSSVTLDLKPNKNNWIIGYPLVKINTAIDQKSDATSLTPLVWGTDIHVTRDNKNVLVTRKTSPTLVAQDGDFYVDFYKGTIVSYKQATTYIRLTFENFNALTAGAPWGTHNVIPTWEESSSLCSVSLVSTSGSSSIYTLSLPTVERVPRVYSGGKLISGGSYTNWLPDTQFYYNPGQLSQYKLPLSLTKEMSDGDIIPEGFVILWDETLGRAVPSITSIKYKTTSSLTIETPPGWLNEGASYRILTAGTSLSEAVSYLMTSQRYDTHTGITNSAKLGYSIPLSHRDLEGRYTDDVTFISGVNKDYFKFSESIYATNQHPQYLHRAGYLSSDMGGNTSNAMRGHLVFSGTLEDDGTFPMGQSKTESGCYTGTPGICFGSGYTSSQNGSARINFYGGQGLTDWEDAGSTGAAKRFGFGLQETGALPSSARSEETYGALTYSPWYGTPLYLRGQGWGADSDYWGAVLGFDLGRNAEMNYIKLLPGYRDSTFDVPHLPARIDQAAWATGVHTANMPGLGLSVCAEQTREFRVRGVSYVADALYDTKSLGGSVTRADDSAIDEFKHYFTSPGIIGADFINCYGNAIFFSDQGDGTKTSFTEYGKIWLDNNLADASAWTGYYETGQFNPNMPIGLYYLPYSADVVYSHRFLFSISDTIETGYFSQPLTFGDRTGFEYVSNLGGNVRLSTRPEAGEDGGGIVFAAGATSKESVDTNISGDVNYYDEVIALRADNSLSFSSVNNIFLSSASILFSAGDSIGFSDTLSFPVGVTATITGVGNFNASSNLILKSGDEGLIVSSSTSSSFISQYGMKLGVDSSTGSYVRITESGIDLNVSSGGKIRLLINNLPVTSGNVVVASNGEIVVG